MAIPSWRATGAIASGAGAISPGVPTGTVRGDLLLMFLENDGSEAAPTASGWTQLLTVATASATTDTRLTVLWKIAESGTPATTTNDPGDHIIGRILCFTRGTFDYDTPFDTGGSGGYVTSVEDTADTSASVTGFTTQVANCLVVVAICGGFDHASSAGTAEFSSWTNAALGSLTERIDNRRIDGNGGQLGVATGTKAAAGAIGSTTATLANAAYKAMATIAIREAQTASSKTSQLQDDFNGAAIDTGKWTETDSAGNLSQLDGLLQFERDSGDYSKIVSVGKYDFTASELIIYLPQMPGGVNPGLEFYCIAVDERVPGFTSHGNSYFWLWQANNEFTPEYTEWGTTSWGSNYTGSNRWLRLRESGGTVYYDTSPDGIVWTNHATRARAGNFLSCRVRIECGDYAYSGGPFTTGKVDNLNRRPPIPQVMVLHDGA